MGGAHGHSHGLVDPSVARSRAGVRVVAISLFVLAATAVLQAAASGSAVRASPALWTRSASSATLPVPA